MRNLTIRAVTELIKSKGFLNGRTLHTRDDILFRCQERTKDIRVEYVIPKGGRSRPDENEKAERFYCEVLSLLRGRYGAGRVQFHQNGSMSSRHTYILITEVSR